MDFVELPPGVSPAGDLVDPSAFVEVVEAGIGIGLQRSLIVLQVQLRTLSLTVGRVGEPDGRRGCIR